MLVEGNLQHILFTSMHVPHFVDTDLPQLYLLTSKNMKLSVLRCAKNGMPVYKINIRTYWKCKVT